MARPSAGCRRDVLREPLFDPTQSRGGPWAWFRLIDETRTAAPDPQRVLLNLHNVHHTIRATVEPASAAGNPFTSGAWRQFTCES